MAAKRQTAQVFLETLVNQHAHFGLKHADKDVMMLLVRPKMMLVGVICKVIFPRNKGANGHILKERLSIDEVLKAFCCGGFSLVFK